MVSTKVTLSGIELDNPIIPASGTFGYGYEYAELYDINCLGTFSFKGTTRDPRFGNPTPRIAECTSGMINAVGLQNPGVDAVIAQELPKLKACFNKPVMANVSGFSIDDYAYTCEKLDKEEQVGWLEVNISCPNVHNGGMSFGVSPAAAAEVTKAVKAVTKKPVIANKMGGFSGAAIKPVALRMVYQVYDAVKLPIIGMGGIAAAEVTRAVKAVTKKPVFMKLSPNVTDIVSIARACEEAGADGISLINTLLGMRINLKNRKPVIANKMGGFSGSAILPVAVRMVYQVYDAVKIPVIGMGGVSCAEDVIEMMLAGATAVEIGAANLVDPFVCRDIIADLPRVMAQYGISDLKDIIGAAH